MSAVYLLWHLFLAFLVGSVWTTFVTFVAERFGSAIGGFVGGIPSTAAFSFFFIGLNQSSNAAAQVTTVFPLTFSFTCSFLLFYALLAKRGFAFGMTVSLLIWWALSTLVVFSNLQDFITSLFGCVLICFAVYYFFVEKLKLGSFEGALTHLTVFQLAWRAILSGSVVILAVLLSQIGGPLLGAVFSAFPAVFTSTLFLVNQSKGLNFSRAITKPLFVSAALTVIPYSIAVRYSYPSLGIWFGTVVSYAVAVPFAFVSYRLSKSKATQPDC